MAEAEAQREDGIDVVSIVTPNWLHFPAAMAFIERGIHVVCDKPMTTTLEDAEALVRAITGDNGEHVVSYATEAGQFQERGYSAVICGPGDIAHAHQPNEHITRAQFQAGERFVTRVVEHLCRA